MLEKQILFSFAAFAPAFTLKPAQFLTIENFENSRTTLLEVVNGGGDEDDDERGSGRVAA